MAALPPTPRDGDGRFQLSPRVQATLPPLDISDVLPPEYSPLPPPAALPTEYLEHMFRLRALAEAQRAEEEERRATSLAIANAKTSPREPRQNAGRPLRSRAEVVGLAGLLSSASDCEKLLRGTLSPAAFSKRVSTMTPEAMEAWLGAFGACVARLGSTLTNLHDQLQRQRASTKTKRVAAATAHVVERVGGIEEGLDALRAGVVEAVGTACAAQQAAVQASVDRLCTTPKRVATLWKRTLTMAVVAEQRAATELHGAMRGVGLATDSLSACADAICAHATRLLRAGDACLYVAVVSPSNSKKEDLYRLRGIEPSDEEERLCSKERIHGAQAVAVPATCFAAKCLANGRALGPAAPRTLLVPTGWLDANFNRNADGPVSGANAQSLLFVNLSDESGPLRAVLRVATHCPSAYGAPEEPSLSSPSRTLTPAEAHTLEQLAPVFMLALRHACRSAALEPVAAARATLMESLNTCLGTLSEESKAGELGGVTDAFAREACSALGCDGCNIYVYDEVNTQLMQLPADTELEPRVVSLAPKEKDHPKHGGPGGSGVAGLVASTRQLVNSKEGKSDVRIKPAADHPFGAPADFAVASLLCVPIESVSSGGLLGVCEVINRRVPAEQAGGEPGDDDATVPFEEEQEATLYALMRVAALAIENYQLYSGNMTMRNGLLARRRSQGM